MVTTSVVDWCSRLDEWCGCLRPTSRAEPRGENRPTKRLNSVVGRPSAEDPAGDPAGAECLPIMPIVTMSWVVQRVDRQ